MRVLHVEDNSVDADLVRRLLARTAPEIHIEQVFSLAQAQICLQHPGRYDLALLDLRLPDGSGLDLLADIRERRLPIAVVMLTGTGDQDATIAALLAGADDYTGKDQPALGRLPSSLHDAWSRFQAANTQRAQPLSVLYAECNAADVDLTQRHLARYAPWIRLTVVADGEQVLERFSPNALTLPDFDVVLLDYRLPGLDALETVKVLRAERGLEIPIVMVTGQGSEEVAARAMHLGVNDYLPKHSGYLHKLPATLEKVRSQAHLARERSVLQETARRLESVLDASPVILYTRRLETGDAPLTWVSANVTRLLGYPAHALLQPQWWAQHLHPDDRDAVMAQLATLSANAYIAQDYRVIDGSGQVRWIHDELRLADPLDSPHGSGERLAHGAWRDITEAKRTEQLQETRLEVLDTLMGIQSLQEILDKIANRLEAIHPDIRVSVQIREDWMKRCDFDAMGGARRTPIIGEIRPEPVSARPTGEPAWSIDPRGALASVDTEATTASAGWSIPFKDSAGQVLGRFSVTYTEPRDPTPSELDLIGEFGCIACLAVARVCDETSLRQAATVFESTREGVIVTDLQTRILSVNRAYTEITGYSEDEVLGRRPDILHSGRQDPSFYQTLWANIATVGHWQGEIWNRRKNGEIYPQLLSISTVFDSDGQPSHYVGVMTDISRLKQSEASLEYLIHYDPLTHLPNRRLVQLRLQHALEQSERHGHRLAVLFLDLDHFKNVNDSLGHPHGDELLAAIAWRLRTRLREEDTLGRLGGDEFLILMEHLAQPEGAAEVARTLLELLESPFVLASGPELYIGASIGISLYPDDGDSVTELVKYADVAMYQAKEEGRNTFRFYTPTLTKAANERLLMEARLRRALANNELVLHYQPQFANQGGALIGCEALVRWESPEEGMVSPTRFIALAEETGLIVPIGEWVLRTACEQAKRWLDAGFADLSMAVNLSGRQVSQQDLVARVAAILEQTGLPAAQLKLELTESMIMGQGEQAVNLLAALKALGLRLSFDDFGTGYSSLAYLKRFPIDELKIDRSFVRDIPHERDDMEIAATIIAMARSLRLIVIAEGVETPEQLAFLTGKGCNACQGYLLGRPMPAEAFAQHFLTPH